jgi:hypothetical protein
MSQRIGAWSYRAGARGGCRYSDTLKNDPTSLVCPVAATWSTYLVNLFIFFASPTIRIMVKKSRTARHTRLIDGFHVPEFKVERIFTLCEISCRLSWTGSWTSLCCWHALIMTVEPGFHNKIVVNLVSYSPRYSRFSYRLSRNGKSNFWRKGFKKTVSHE